MSSANKNSVGFDEPDSYKCTLIMKHQKSIKIKLTVKQPFQLFDTKF